MLHFDDNISKLSCFATFFVPLYVYVSYSYASKYIESKFCDRRDFQNWLISGKFPDLPLMKDRLKPTNADYKKRSERDFIRLTYN